VRDVAELMAPRIAGKQQELGVQLSPTLPPALGDARRVRQIIANLLTNAHLYTERGGRIDVSVQAERAWVQVIVQDSGVGMTEEEARRVFERFYRAPARTKDGRIRSHSNPGTGLGLSIVKALVDLHQGEIHVSSAPGRGTTFRVLLPAARSGLDPRRPPEAMRGLRVLVVDDEPEVAALIADQLAPLQLSATIATGGEEALARMRAERFDAVTLDVLMPGMDGFEVLREIRADPDLSSTPIVFVSVFSGRRELAGEWVVSKPIDADELREVLAAAVAARRGEVDQ
jgi:CheY-like chemotaxis protein/anti-sigma regulatory factor (Ser/Thr protein kinase)